MRRSLLKGQTVYMIPQVKFGWLLCRMIMADLQQTPSSSSSSLSLSLSLSLSFSLSLFLSLSIYLSVYLSLSFFISLSIYYIYVHFLSFSVSLYLTIYLSTRLDSVRRFVLTELFTSATDSISDYHLFGHRMQRILLSKQSIASPTCLLVQNCAYFFLARLKTSAGVSYTK